VLRASRDLSEKLQMAIRAAQDAGDLPSFEMPAPVVERPKKPDYGDYASPVAMQLAREARRAPMQIAEAIVKHFPMSDYVAEVNISAPGFVNFRLADSWLQQQVETILEEAESFARMDDYAGRRAQVECVSANPTGPVTVGRVRGGVMGDTLARLLRAMGYDVELEYYFNNAGQQMEKLGWSLRARYRERLGLPFEFPEDGYQGDYLYDLADELIAEVGQSLAEEESFIPFKDFAEEHIFRMIKASLSRINIVFDSFFNENWVYDDGSVWTVLDQFEAKGIAYEQDGAWWLKTSELRGDEKDRVLVKSTGEPTYRLPDIAYHINKLQRGFDLAINILGADHIEEYPDVALGVELLGYEAERIHVIIHQFVTLVEGGKVKRMSTRRGEFVTLDELVDDVGPDAVRYFLLSRSADSQMEFDLDLARQQSNENPVYYIQNAHVRCAGIARVADERGASMEGGDVSLLTDPREMALIRKLIELPEVIEAAVHDLTPHRIAFWAHEDLARTFHPVYDEIRALHDTVPEPVAKARLKLYAAAKIVFARALDLMGMSAPEVM
jgi:arginyl-tRNA synthetase